MFVWKLKTRWLQFRKISKILNHGTIQEFVPRPAVVTKIFCSAFDSRYVFSVCAIVRSELVMIYTDIKKIPVSHSATACKNFCHI